MKKLMAALLVSLVLGMIAPSMAATEVAVSGSTTVGPLGALCADAFNAAQSEYHVSVAQTGTGAGVTAIAEGKADVAMASREIKSDEKAKYGDKFQETLIGYDGIAICVSKALFDSGITALTKEQVKKIYAAEITKWSGITVDGASGPDKEIYAISREIGSGTRDTFLEDIFGDKKAETPGVKTYSSANFDIVKAIAGNDAAIGYVGYSYSQTEGLKAVKLEGVELTKESIKDKSYPMARKLYLDTFGDAKPGAIAFIDFVKGPEGQKIALENGFVPL